MKQKALALFALMCLSLWGLEAWAQNPAITFIERSWDDTNKTVVETEKTITDYELLSGSTDPEAWALLGSKDDDKDHYYVVKRDDVTYKTLNVYGRAHLILCIGAKLTCTGGVLVEEGHNNAKFFVHGQTGDNGKLIVTNSYEDTAGIGSSKDKKCGEINIQGGDLDVTGGVWGAGIGGGAGFHTVDDAVIKIYGGRVYATGGSRGAGIGGGITGHGGTMYFYGGEIKATSGTAAAGVGGGGNKILQRSTVEGGACGHVYIYAATLTAESTVWGAGIGTGAKSSGSLDSKGELHIYEGAKVKAIGGSLSAGIGGGQASGGIRTYIEGGTVEAKGGMNGAGIGCGDYDDYVSCSNGGEIRISGGTVTATGTGTGAGIGGGGDSYGGNVYITGGTVVAIAGEKCKGREAGSGSAIGCGYDVSSKDSEKKCGKLEFGDNMRVTGGDAENNIERVFTSYERDPACRWRSYVKIEPCSHETPTVGSDLTEAIYYSFVSDSKHDRYCRYCKTVVSEDHSSGVCPCGNIGDFSFTIYVPSSSTSGSGYQQKQTYKVKVGNEFYLPECDDVPAGYKFLGWEMNPNETEEGYDKWAAMLGGDEGGDDKLAAGTSVKALQDMTDPKFYARFLYDLDWEMAWDDNNPMTETIVTISHPDITSWSFKPGNYTTGSLTITSEVMTDEDNHEYGTRYTANATYILNGYEYNFSSRYDVLNDLTLQDNADNRAAIEQYAGKRTTARLTGRTLYKDGMWNTLCLPFDVTIAGSPLEGATVVTVTNASIQSKQLNLEYSDPLQKLDAGVPYLVKWETPGDNIVDPVFTAVTLKDKLSPVNAGALRFVGIFEPTLLPANSKDILYIGADGKLYYPDADVTLGAFRGFFEVMFGGDDGTTAIDNSQLTIDNSAGNIYDLQGRKVLHPTKGLYIVNGKKVVIK